ncbi:HK97-gp10 family putative phage morphogenesis protein [Flavobacterium sp.]|jgi:HK97 gp10 family phage protein|uniref:HK97-gp10 family putative phage morphogenesis protein n=1 Tax=Flavobacterium sp. TaxID=239 RepID=UPI0037BFE5B6
MSISVSVSGFRELDMALAELPKATARNVLVRTLRKAGEPIAEEARRHVPVRTGTLRDSISVSARVKNKVGSAEYSAAMKAGLGKQAAGAALRAARRAAKGQGSFAEAYVGPARGKGVIRYAHIVEFGSNDTAPQAYMRPAWDARQREALDIIKAELGNEIIKAARRVGRSKKQSADVKYRASIAAMMAAGY